MRGAAVLLCVVALLCLTAVDAAKRSRSRDLLHTASPIRNVVFRFTGTNYIELDHEISYHLNGSFTLEAWIKPSAVGDVQPIVARFPGVSGGRAEGDVDLNLFVAADGAISFQMGGGGSDLGINLVGPVVKANEWTHVAVVVVGVLASKTVDKATLFVNGTSAGAQAWQAGTRQLMNEPTWLGYRLEQLNFQAFTGAMDEVRFWRSARTAAQISNYMNVPIAFVEFPVDAALFAYYTFQGNPATGNFNGSGAQEWDNSEEPWFDGVVHGTPSRVEDAQDLLNYPLPRTMAPNAGPLHYGLDFKGFYATGGQQHAVLTPLLNDKLTAGFTFEAWIYSLEPQELDENTFRPIVARFNPQLNRGLTTPQRGSNAGQDFVLQLDARSGRLAFFMGGGSSAACASSAQGYGIWLGSAEPNVVSGLEWTHVAVSVHQEEGAANPTEAHLYLNGREVPPQKGDPGNAWAANCTRQLLKEQPITVGFYQNNAMPQFAQYWNGAMDELRFWNRALTSAQIQDRMSAPCKGHEEGLVGYWKLNEGKGSVIWDSTANKFRGDVRNAAWLLAQPPAECYNATAGVPTPVPMLAYSPTPSLPPNNDTFIFYVNRLPTNGTLFVDSTTLEEVTEDFVNLHTPIKASAIYYVASSDFTGEDYFTYSALSSNSGLQSDAHHIIFNVTKGVVPPICKPDICGVCNGDGSSCTGGCNGKGAQWDACGICGGDNSTCMCTVFKTYTVDELECVLFEFSVNRSIARIEYTIENLMNTLVALEDFDGWYDNWFSLKTQVQFTCGLVHGCLDAFNGVLDPFLSVINTHNIVTCPDA